MRVRLSTLFALLMSVALLVSGGVRPTAAQSRAASAESEKSPGAVVFSDDFSTDPNTNGLWTIHRYVGDTRKEARWISSRQRVALTRADAFLGVAMFANYDLTATGWEARFEYLAGGGTGADGFVFMFYKDRAAYGQPSPGGDLGFELAPEPGTPVPGYGIEFDSFNNPDRGDPSPNHFALIQDTTSNHLAFRRDMRTQDNLGHSVLIQFDAGHVQVWIDDDSSPVIDYVLADPNYTFSGVGFGAGTGSATNNHLIDDFVLSIPDN